MFILLSENKTKDFFNFLYLISNRTYSKDIQ